MNYIKRVLVLIAAIIVLTPVAFAGDSGEWKNQKFKVKGDWSIEQRADGNFLVLSEDFKTKNAPDLKLFVSKKPYTEINGSNATADAALISLLKSNTGGQSYRIPDNINMSDYQSLLIHCEKFSKLWASTPLK